MVNPIGPFITRCLENLDLSEETLFRVGLLLKSQFEDPEYDLDPHNMSDEDPAEMNMAFFLYVIKDALEHVGFLKDSNSKNAARVASRELRMALARFE